MRLFIPRSTGSWPSDVRCNRSVLPAARAGPGNAVLRSVNIDIILISLEEKLQSHSRGDIKLPAVLKSVTISDRH